MLEKTAPEFNINLAKTIINEAKDLISAFALDNQVTLNYTVELAALYTNYMQQHHELCQRFGITDYNFECQLNTPKFAEDRETNNAKIILKTVYNQSITLPAEYKKEAAQLTRLLGYQTGVIYKEAELMLFVSEVNTRKNAYKQLQKYLTLTVLKGMCDQCLTYSCGETRLRKHFVADKKMVRYSEFLKHPTIVRITEKIVEASKKDVYLWKMVASEIKYKVLNDLANKHATIIQTMIKEDETLTA